MLFICPKCSGKLSKAENNTVKCSLGHSYDIAKEGYLNLLLSSCRKTHGDNREMVDARRAFLDTGAYFPLAKEVSELAEKYFCGNRILDIGCGEGYYTDIIYKKLSANGELNFSAFDISRDAVKRSAKRNPNISLAVASAYRQPFADSTFDMAFNMFSPLAHSELLRVLRPGGIFIMAVPGEEHLFGLKKEAYETPYRNELSDPELDGFSLAETKRIKYTLNLNNNLSVRSLFMMTPYAYRTPKESRERILALDSLSTDAEFVIFVYRKL